MSSQPDEDIKVLEVARPDEDEEQWQGRSYKRVEAGMDSGAAVTMMPKRLLPNKPTYQSEGSRMGKKCRTAKMRSCEMRGEPSAVYNR